MVNVLLTAENIEFPKFKCSKLVRRSFNEDGFGFRA